MISILKINPEQKKNNKMNPVVIDTMNDILNKVETREWRRVTQQRDTLLRHNKRLAKRVETMQEYEKEIENLKKERDEYLENWKSTTRKYVAVTTRKQRLKALTDK